MHPAKHYLETIWIENAYLVFLYNIITHHSLNFEKWTLELNPDDPFSLVRILPHHDTKWRGDSHLEVKRIETASI